MAKYDIDRLAQLGERRDRNRAEGKEIAAELEAEISKAAKAGVLQVEIARQTRMTRESIAQLCRPAAERWKPRSRKDQQ